MPAVRFPSLEVRTRAFQAGNDGFKVYAPLRSVLDVVRRTTAPRRFESCPIHFRLCVRVVYGASSFHFGRRRADVPRTSCDPLRWCAATHRRFKSFRKRS